MDDFLAHQTPETFDHVYTGDRAFYDRYYFNCHSCSDEIFLIAGMSVIELEVVCNAGRGSSPSVPPITAPRWRSREAPTSICGSS